MLLRFGDLLNPVHAGLLPHTVFNQASIDLCSLVNLRSQDGGVNVLLSELPCSLKQDGLQVDLANCGHFGLLLDTLFDEVISLVVKHSLV